MLKRLHVRWFRCLREVDLALGPLTVLVGPNASGKSALIEALNPHRQLEARDLWRRDLHQRFLFRMEYSDGTPCQRELAPGDSVAPLAKYKYQLLRLNLDSLRIPNQVQEQSTLTGTGDNLTNVFASLDRNTQIAIGRQLSELVGVISDVEARPHPGELGRHTLVFRDRWKSDVLYFPGEVSDGTMLLLAYLVCQRQPQAPDLLAIEEPERGLHPYLLGELVDILRKLSQGSEGVKPMQVVIATHSADFLDHLHPEEVRFLSRNPEDGSVRVEQAPLESAEWRDAIAEYRHSLRSLWLSGSLGGVPGH